MKILNKFFLFFIFIFFCSNNSSLLSKEIKIINKINGEIITNIDVEIEHRYLLALNNDLKKIPKNEVLKIAKDSLIREKIKLYELKKYYDVKNFSNEKLLENIIQDFYQRLNIENEDSFKEYLVSNQITYEQVKEKIKLEVLWNQFIGQKFGNQIIINENKLRESITLNRLNVKNTFEYELSEIVIQAKNNDELVDKINEIKLNIDTIGFKSTATKFSLSESAKFGGSVGTIKESQLSDKIRLIIQDLEVGQISEPIQIGSSFMILKIDNKNIIKIEEDEEQVLRNLIEFEKRKQFEQFSQIYFNKIKINSQIDAN